ncbi:hypothetical protein [Cellulomonas dongxiuzhuiae]|uniref:hypothetical protein n=1 Tax=Cellulomonas dongxiuzhuiae TaxID=2819979 RepID=UPI001AAFDE24|nr:hypothetical protein [Cellulomonas dongxiuzhuiae]MBO3089958.1 hypothetical protein [Cellulomonas dongxiuzhuiae]MBO3090115.1 hypothetical protein [Cellulomonas dongxiuzhuiae]
MTGLDETHLSQLRVRLKEQIENLEVSAARYDAGWSGEANRLAVTVRVLVHDTSMSKSLLKQMGAKESMRWIDSNGGLDARAAAMFSSLVVFQAAVFKDRMELQILPLDQADILARGLLLDFATWWKTAPVMVGGGETISRFDVVDMLANQDGGAHVDLKKERFVKLLRSVPQVAPFFDGEDQGVSFGLPAHASEGLARETLRAAMRTIAEEVWLAWNNQLDLLDPGWRERPQTGGRIGPEDFISGLR